MRVTKSVPLSILQLITPDLLELATTEDRHTGRVFCSIQCQEVTSCETLAVSLYLSAKTAKSLGKGVLLSGEKAAWSRRRSFFTT
jgi:hypothetical protein